MAVKLTFLIVIWPTLFPCSVSGQQIACNLTVSGHVYISDTTELDARGASIRFPSIKKGGITDSDGNFKIVGICPGRSRIVVSYQGYRSLDTVFNINGDLILNFLMFSNAQE